MWLYAFVSLLLELYTFKPFTEQMDPKRELRRELEKCIGPSVDSWFRMLKATVMPNRGVRNKEIKNTLNKHACCHIKSNLNFITG